MIEIISIGDRLMPGLYRTHSRFSKAAYFECGDELAAMVIEEIGSGPINIVMRGVDLGALQSLNINDSSLCFDDHQIDYDDSHRFHSGMDFPNSDLKILTENIASFEISLRSCAPPKSLAFLIDPQKKADFVTSFEIEFVKRIENGAGLLLQGNYVEMARKLRGVGLGLTPGGDDFIAGMIIAYRLFEKLMWIDRSKQITEIYANAIGGNIISNAFLRCARDGSLSEKQKSLLTAIIFQTKEDVASCTREICNVGETSGADWGVGLLMTLKRMFN